MLKVSVHQKKVLVDVCLSLLDLLEEDDHVGCGLNLYTSALTRPEAVALFLEGKVQKAEGKSCLVQAV